jgi:hypothetical protein
MNVTRRSVIKNLLIITGGVTLIPSCMQEKSKASVLLRNVKVDAGQEALLAELAETIIPATDTPGAKDLYAHLFIMKMVDDCTTKEDQQKYLDGLKGFENLTKKRFNKPFAELTPDQRKSLLTDLEAKKDIPEDVQSFYDKTKRLTVQAYVTSKHFLTDVQPYQLVPGKFAGCAPVQPSNKKAYKVI